MTMTVFLFIIDLLLDCLLYLGTLYKTVQLDIQMASLYHPLLSVNQNIFAESSGITDHHG